MLTQEFDIGDELNKTLEGAWLYADLTEFVDALLTNPSPHNPLLPFDVVDKLGLPEKQWRIVKKIMRGRNGIPTLNGISLHPHV